MMMRKLTGFLFTLVLLASCGNRPAAEQNMYVNPQYWFDNGREVNPDLVDVFYILPTCVFDTQNPDGQVCHYASLTDSTQRQQMKPSYQLADEIFADSANFFAPYYRHISLDTWMEGEQAVAERFPHAMKDVEDAFAYFLEHKNQGRPFVLAGFSQGGKCVVELIKQMDAQTAERLIAAYVCGYRVTPQDLQATRLLKRAKGADDTGVTIVYNTVSDTLAISPVLSQDNQWVMNPVSWTNDEEDYALNDSVNIRLDNRHKVLIATGLDTDKLFVPSLERLFPKGNLHLQELLLYKDQLMENVKTRIRAFAQNNR